MVAITLHTVPALDRSHRRLGGQPDAARARPLSLVAPASTGRFHPLGAVVAVLFAIVVLVAGAQLLRSPMPAPGGAAGSYVVAEGDTMWSIARATAPAGEAATYVEALVAANGGGTVVPGQVLTLPRP